MERCAHLLVVGNAKGGSGKSTTAMHIISRLLNMQYTVAAIDLDSQQQTLGRYLQNRERFIQKNHVDLPTAPCEIVALCQADRQEDAAQQEKASFEKALDKLKNYDVIVIDCPGADTFLTREAHCKAHTLLTPINDSFVDLDVLARVCPDTLRILEPSWYSLMVWEARKQRHFNNDKAIDWLVVRNRLSHVNTRNKQHLQKALDSLASQIGFRTTQGLGDRVIFRELFLKGLTLADLKGRKLGIHVTMNHLVAHQEIKELVQQIKLPAANSCLRLEDHPKNQTASPEKISSMGATSNTTNNTNNKLPNKKAV